jgi:hypothetical protein
MTQIGLQNSVTMCFSLCYVILHQFCSISIHFMLVILCSRFVPQTCQIWRIKLPGQKLSRAHPDSRIWLDFLSINLGLGWFVPWFWISLQKVAVFETQQSHGGVRSTITVFFSQIRVMKRFKTCWVHSQFQKFSRAKGAKHSKAFLYWFVWNGKKFLIFIFMFLFVKARWIRQKPCPKS